MTGASTSLLESIKSIKTQQLFKGVRVKEKSLLGIFFGKSLAFAADEGREIL